VDTKKANTVLLLLGTMAFLTNGDIYSAAPLLVTIASDLQIRVSQAALSVTAYMLAFGLFTIILGPMGDRFGRARILILSSFGTAIFSCMSIFVTNLPFLIGIRIANCAFDAGIMPVSHAIIGESYDDSERQNAIAKLLGMMFLGGATGTAIGGAISYISSWKTVYFCYGFCELIVAFLLVKKLEQRSGTIQKLKYIQIYSQALNNNRLLGVLFVIILNGLCIIGTFPFSGELLKQVTGYNVLQIGLILSMFGVGGIIAGRRVAFIRQKIGSRLCLLAGIVGAISVFLLSFATHLAVLIVAFAGFGMAFVMLHSTLVETAQGVIPQLRGTIMALVSFCVFTGSGVGTIINKQIMEHGAITNIFRASAILLLGIGLIALIILNLIQRKAKEPSYGT
jgi:predicted MFS family arabinose efflux permease